MKNLKVLFAMMAVALFTFFSFNAQAQGQSQGTIGTLLSGLVNVNVQNVAVDVETGDITVVNVEDVLNNSVRDIDILNNALNNNEVASRNRDFLNNLLQNADILTDTQVVVGVLSGGQIVFQEL